MTFSQVLEDKGVILAQVNGGSMYPVFNTGDFVLVRPGEYVPGDIISYTYKGYTMTHRLIEVEPRILTKGDNVPIPDDQVIEPEDVLGVAFAVFRPSTNQFFKLDRNFIHPRFLGYARLENRLAKILAGLRRKPSHEMAKRFLKPLYYGWVFRGANSFQKQVGKGNEDA